VNGLRGRCPDLNEYMQFEPTRSEIEWNIIFFERMNINQISAVCVLKRLNTLTGQIRWTCANLPPLQTQLTLPLRGELHVLTLFARFACPLRSYPFSKQRNFYTVAMVIERASVGESREYLKCIMAPAIERVRTSIELSRMKRSCVNKPV